MTWVKICGTTNLEDALAAVDAGADALGFVFAPSPRRISPRDAARIVAGLPKSVEKIGVFVNQKPEIVLETVEKAGLTGVQLHGDEDAKYVRAIVRAGKSLKTIKALPAELLHRAGAGVESSGELPPGVVLMWDSRSPGQRGGTGKSFDWQKAAPLVRFMQSRHRIIVAGGLNPMNVGRAIETLHPWGVDVVSGVEREPGEKDHEKVGAFIAAVRAAGKEHAKR